MRELNVRITRWDAFRGGLFAISRSFGFWMGMAGLVLGAFFLVFQELNPSGDASPGLVLSAAAAVLSFSVGCFSIIVVRWVTILLNPKYRNIIRTHFVADEVGIKERGETTTRSFQWGAVKEIAKKEDAIYIRAGGAHPILPRHSFDSDNAFEDFYSYLIDQQAKANA